MQLAWRIFKRFLLSPRAGALIRTVSWLSILSVGLGVFSLVVVVCVMDGFGQSIRDRLLAIEPHLVIELSPTGPSSEQNWQSFSDRFTREFPDAKTYRYEEQDILMQSPEGLFRGAEARGVETEAFAQIQKQINENLTEGEERRPIYQFGPGQVFVGIDLARTLGLFEGDLVSVLSPEALLLPVGEVPRIDKAEVSGFIESRIAEIDHGVVYYLRGQALPKLESSRSLRHFVEIRLLDPMKYREAQSLLVKNGFMVESWRERNSALMGAITLERYATGIFLALSALIAMLSIATVMILLIQQKSREIGLMLAMGLSREAARTLFSRVGFMLASLGLGGGLLTGFASALYLQTYPLNVLPDIYYDSRILAKVSPGFFVIVVVSSFAIAFFSAWLPAKTVTQLSPSQALRNGRQRS